MWNLQTFLPIFISVALPLGIWYLTNKRADRQKNRTDVIEDKGEMIQGEAKFRADILEQMRAAQADNSKLRADLWDCQKKCLESQANAAEMEKLKAENEVLNRLFKQRNG